SHERFEDFEAFRGAKFGLTGALGMRHHSQDVAPWVADSGNVVERAVGISFRRHYSRSIGIAEDDAMVFVQFAERRVIAEVVAFHMADWDGKYLALPAGGREGSIGALDAHMNRLADVFQA